MRNQLKTNSTLVKHHYGTGLRPDRGTKAGNASVNMAREDPLIELVGGACRERESSLTIQKAVTSEVKLLTRDLCTKVPGEVKSCLYCNRYLPNDLDGINMARIYVI